MFGAVLKEVRQKNGDSLRKLSERIDISPSYISGIENELTRASNETFEKIISIYPNYKDQLITAFCEDILPQSAKEKLLGFDKNALGNLLELTKALDLESQKIITNAILEKLELLSLRQGKNEALKNLFEKAKNKINDL